MAMFFAVQLAQFAHSQASGGGVASRAIQSRIAANNCRGTATSASWNVTLLGVTGKEHHIGSLVRTRRRDQQKQGHCQY